MRNNSKYLHNLQKGLKTGKKTKDPMEKDAKYVNRLTPQSSTPEVSFWKS